MASKKNNAIQSMLLDLLRRCEGNHDLEDMAKRVVDEFNKIHQIDTKVNDPDRRRINKILHAMRGLETGLETFLAIYGVAPSRPQDKSMGKFMLKLKTPPSKGPKYVKMPSHVFAAGFSNEDSIRCKRNLYLHQAGMYPTDKETKRIIESVYKFYQQVLLLG
ncbi:hypothetical protein [Parabacteroides goldsteinii]|uniref:hypothetical protein n=1 Tax=Parabacteroides goldsteinii TaxID=328812 RepID=UPI0026757069|nr:hypothetical protein [Parabacteroides goldsteinii]